VRPDTIYVIAFIRSFFLERIALARNVTLRGVAETDLPIFFEYESDPAANHMAAFTRKNPADRNAFEEHWKRILGDKTVVIRTVLFDGHVVGSVARYVDIEFRRPEVTYWIGKEYWGKGIATKALSKFLGGELKDRPIYARSAKDNIASIRVLEKCGFKIVSYGRGFANARGKEIEEVILELRAGASEVQNQ
jgi:RimJ/RimL family protein N-acetyltransferase